MAKKGGTVKFKNCTEKIKSMFMIYVNFENVLMTENQHNVGCSYGYKLVRVDDQFSKLFKTYLGQNAGHKFVTNMVKEGKYWSRFKNHFNKELVMTKGDNENFEIFT